MANTKISAMTLKATPVGTESIPIADAGLSKRILVSTLQLVTAKNASNGYVGKTLHKIDTVNNAGTITSFIQNINTIARTYTLQDRNGTLADDTDLATKASISGTPVDNQLAVWTGAGTIEGDSALTFDTTTDTLTTVNARLTAIELGHDSDTTITRVSAGRIAVEGVNIVTISSIDTLTNKTLVAPILGTPASGDLSNCTGTAASLTAGQATAALGLKTATTTVSVSAATAPTTGQVLTATNSTTATWQTPTSGGDVSKVGTPVDNQIGVWTGDGTIEGDTALTFDTATDTLTTVNARLTAIELGHDSDTTISRVSAGRIAVEGVNIPSISSTDTLTNKRITPRTGTVATSATPTINSDNVDYFSITALDTNITSFTTNLTGAPTTGQSLHIMIIDDGTPRTIAWGAGFEDGAVLLPTTTIASTRLDILLKWNELSSKWRCLAAG